LNDAIMILTKSWAAFSEFGTVLTEMLWMVAQ